MDHLTERYLEHVRVEKLRGAVELYAGPAKLSDHAAKAGWNSHACKQPRSPLGGANARAGRSGRGIARSFPAGAATAWLGRQGLVASNPVQDVRGPKGKPRPRR
jgi:integrase/recombinase XerC